MFVMFLMWCFQLFIQYSAAFCQLCFYNKDWIGRICSLTHFVYVYMQLLSRHHPKQYSRFTGVLSELSQSIRLVCFIYPVLFLFVLVCICHHHCCL